MKKGMLITVAGMALLAGTADVRAACIPTQDCASLGYKYTAAQCPDGAIACPFDTSKFFCMEPQTCNYTYTAESCAANCQNVGSSSCVRNGTTYYASCGSSKCSSGQTCNNGTCYTKVEGGYCCGYIDYCGYDGGTSNVSDSSCQSHWGKSCYEQCKTYGYPDCNDLEISCRSSGGTLELQYCGYDAVLRIDYNPIVECLY